MVELLGAPCARRTLLAALLGSAACGHAQPLSKPARSDVQVAEPTAEPSALPQGAERCSAVAPMRVPESQRELVRLVSQSEPLPWQLALPVELYERAEQSDADGKRAVAELLRFAGRPAQAEIERELARIFVQRISWAHADDANEARSSCAEELACTPLRGRFLDPRTVLLERGLWGPTQGEGAHCSAALQAWPRAFEVSVRAGTNSELRQARVALLLLRDGIARSSEKRYASAQAAARAQWAALTGHEELPMFAGVAASSFGTRRGTVIEQRGFASYDELALQLADRARVAQAERSARLGVGQLAQVDVADGAAVKSAFDKLRANANSTTPHGELLALDLLLSRARMHAPRDEGLARRHYDLQLTLLHEPRAALATAEQVLKLAPSDLVGWELCLRAALAALSEEARLRLELLRAHSLSPDRAQRMARELTARAGQEARSPEDYGHAEWRFLEAQRLAKEAARVAKQRATLRLALRELPRLLGYLATLDEPLDLRLLALGKREPAAGPAGALTSGAGRPGWLLAAASADDAQLTSLGQALSSELEEGAVELYIGLVRPGQARSSTLVLSGRREGAELMVESLSSTLARLPWATIERLLAAPLRALSGAAYPPDVLTIHAESETEALAVVRAAETEPRVRCTKEGSLVQCRGALSDAFAAARALRAVVRSELSKETRACWSGAE